MCRLTTHQIPTFQGKLQHSVRSSKAQSVEDVRVFSNQPSHQHDCHQEDMGMCRFLNVTDSMEIEDGGPATA